MYVRARARQTAVRTIILGARSHNALRTIVGIPLSGLEWFIHVDQLFFLTERLTDQSAAWARERPLDFTPLVQRLASSSRPREKAAKVNYYRAISDTKSISHVVRDHRAGYRVSIRNRTPFESIEPLAYRRLVLLRRTHATLFHRAFYYRSIIT